MYFLRYALFLVATIFATSGCNSFTTSDATAGPWLWDTEILVVNQTSEPLDVYAGTMRVAKALAPGKTLSIHAEALGEYTTTIAGLAKGKSGSAERSFYASDYNKHSSSWVIRQNDLR